MASSAALMRSAGSLVGAYSLTNPARESPNAATRVGPSIYYDELTRPIGKEFIDQGWVPRALGLGAIGLLYRPVRAFQDLRKNFFGSPILNLDWLLFDCIREKRPLDWRKFDAKASGWLRRLTGVLETLEGSFSAVSKPNFVKKNLKKASF